MYYVGIDLGGTNIAAGVVSQDYKIIAKDSTPTKADRDPELIIKDMGALCDRVIEKAGITYDDVISAGIATPGTADSSTGIVEYANNLPFRHFPLADTLKKYTKFKEVHIENDANAAAWGEAVAGAAKDVKDSVFITLGTGVGGGIVIDRKVYSGFNYAGAELGHMVIVYEGEQCTCGRKGCWEAYSSATGLIRMTKKKMQECPDSTMWKYVGGDISKVSGRTAFACMENDNDKPAAEVVDDYIAYLACGLINIINIFQPEILSIGGGICHEGEWLMAPLRRHIEKATYGGEGSTIKQCKVVIAELGNDAGIIGGAVLGI